MEKIIQFVASLPSTSVLQGKLTDLLITNLWNVLLHPPLSYVADQYQYRTADGSYNVPIAHKILFNCRISCILNSARQTPPMPRVSSPFKRNSAQSPILVFSLMVLHLPYSSDIASIDGSQGVQASSQPCQQHALLPRNNHYPRSPTPHRQMLTRRSLQYKPLGSNHEHDKLLPRSLSSLRQ